MSRSEQPFRLPWKNGNSGSARLPRIWCAFDFCETAFGEGQELVVFVTELTVNRYSAWFIGENGCDRYYKYNKGLLFRERQKGILEEMDEVRDLMEGRKE